MKRAQLQLFIYEIESYFYHFEAASNPVKGRRRERESYSMRDTKEIRIHQISWLHVSTFCKSSACLTACVSHPIPTPSDLVFLAVHLFTRASSSCHPLWGGASGHSRLCQPPTHTHTHISHSPTLVTHTSSLLTLKPLQHDPCLTPAHTSQHTPSGQRRPQQARRPTFWWRCYVSIPGRKRTTVTGR